MKIKFLLVVVTLSFALTDTSEATRNPSPQQIKIRTSDRTNCFSPKLWTVLQRTANHFGRKVNILSAYRSPKNNARRGGAKNSMHIKCKAADISVSGISGKKLARYLARVPGRGGVGYYCGNRIHIDIGKKRAWGPCKPGRRTGLIQREELNHADSCDVEHGDLLPVGFSHYQQLVIEPEEGYSY